MINAHDRDRFEVHLLVRRSPIRPPSAATADHAEDRIWRDRRHVERRACAATCAEAGLDVLVDLNGYSRQRASAAVPVPRRRGARSAWSNMYATTGIPDCRLAWSAMPLVDPADEERSSARARAPRAGHAIWRSTCSIRSRRWRRRPWLRTGSRHLRLASTSAYKITDPVVAAWSRILLRRARLPVCCCAIATLDEPSNRADLLARFAANGIGAGPADAGGRRRSISTSCAAMAEIDIALDTFPYNGGTTTAEALWQGVPATDLQRRPLGQPHQPLAAAGGGSAAVGRRPASRHDDSSSPRCWPIRRLSGKIHRPCWTDGLS